MKKVVVPTLVALMTLVATACGAAGSSAKPIGPEPATTRATDGAARLPSEPGAVTMGAADFPESDLLANVYAGALRAKGVKVTVHPDIGERPAYLAALRDHSIGAIPEYTGALLSYLDTSSTAESSADVYRELKAQTDRLGLMVTAYAPAQDVDTITVTKATADKYSLKSIADLKPVAGRMSLGAPAPFQTVPYGISGLQRLYGVTFERFVPLSASGSITQTALVNGTVDAADIFSTDPAIEKYGFVSLQDTKNMFAAENIVPVFRDDVVTQPMVDASNSVSAKLTTEVLRGLVARVNDGQPSASVADEWLKDSGLA